MQKEQCQIATKLASEVEECSWSMISEHVESGITLLLDKSLDLIEFGVAVAKDDVTKIQSWQQEELFKNAQELDCKEYSSDPHKKFAKFIIVQPFVLLQYLDG
jgi:hypothetical protein